MIVVRNIFQLKFGKAKEAKELWKEGRMINTSAQKHPYRVLFDAVGDSYTMIFEITFESLTQFESAMQTDMGSMEWKSWYAKFVPLCRSGKREIFTIFEENK
ncbi:hypothetical protein NF867_16700 [Solitalea sp. MAHUQ-68]|uniref:NIPSNAP domain-containing protein n=1 Tax=Solitalea agri TaxID=2953739 RepID=A0A9X2JE94_9SPHI|nr:hypothetical protein [Solitalea agri]MCO4294504.1 hypothetical protein [Solitalea agri]